MSFEPYQQESKLESVLKFIEKIKVCTRRSQIYYLEISG